MKEQDRNKAWGFTLFADDLRVEIGGKASLIGLYQADIFFPDSIAFPFQIAKFFLMIMYYETKGSIRDDVTFKVTFGDENQNVIELPIARKDLEPSPEEQFAEDVLPEDRERILHSRIPIMLSPFIVPKTGRLRVRAHYSDGSVLKLGSISVRQTTVDEFNKMLSIQPAQSG